MAVCYSSLLPQTWLTRLTFFFFGRHRGRDNDNKKMEQRSQELDWDMHMSCMNFHSLPSVRVFPVGSVFDPQNQVGVVGPTGIRKSKARCVDSADTVCVQEYHVHLNVDVLQVLPADFPSPCLKSLPASMVSSLATHQIWMNGYCAHHRLRAYARWLHTCILQVMCIEPSASCLSCEHSFPPLAYKAPTSWWSLIETKVQISGGGNDSSVVLYTRSWRGKPAASARGRLRKANAER